MKKAPVNVSRIILAIVIVSCIFGNIFSFLNIDLGFVILTPIRSVLFFASILCLVNWCIRLRKKEVLPHLKSNLLPCLTFGFFVAWFILGAAWVLFGETSANAPTEVVGILTICLLAFCVFTLVKSSEDVQFLLRLCVLCGVILAVLACVEVVFGSFIPGTRYYMTLIERIERKQTLFAPTTVFYNQNDFAAFMLLCLSIVSFWIIRAKTIRDFLSSLGIALVLIIPTVLINSTIFNLLAFGLMLLTILGVVLVRRGSWTVRLLRASGIVIITVVFALFCTDGIRSVAVELNRSYFTTQIQDYYLQNPSSELNPTASSTEPTVPSTEPTAPTESISVPIPPPATLPTIPDLDYSDTEDPDKLTDQLDAFSKNGGTIHIRLWLIRAGWAFFLDSPIIGCGPASFQTNISQNRDFLNQTRWIKSPHFFYTELLSQYGIIMFAAYMGIILYLAVRSLMMTVRELRNGKPGRGVLCLLMTGMFSAAIVMPSGIIRFTSIWIFLLLAVCVFCKGLPADDESSPKE